MLLRLTGGLAGRSCWMVVYLKILYLLFTASVHGLVEFMPLWTLVGSEVFLWECKGYPENTTLHEN